MNNQTNELLKKLAEKLGTTVEYLWTILIKQAHIYSVMGMVESVSLILLAIILFFVRKYLISKIEQPDYGDIDETPTYIISTIICLFGGLGSIISSAVILQDAFIALYNPEYWALSQIIDKLR